MRGCVPPAHAIMEIQEYAAGKVMVFQLGGRLTLESFGLLKRRVRSFVDQGGRRLVLDLADLSYVDSIGVSELVRCHVILGNHDGRLALAALPDHLRQLLRVTRLDQIFDRHATPADAVVSLTQADR